MTLSTREPMPVVLLATHSFAALGLVIATLAQKEGVAAAARSETRSPSGGRGTARSATRSS